MPREAVGTPEPEEMTGASGTSSASCSPVMTTSPKATAFNPLGRKVLAVGRLGSAMITVLSGRVRRR
uniref:Uncharacterized protein n=1 Tax=uncultured marine virus TaxID=186617 RepID=A0A0F7L696_9VIRU|nr:hypothetical protein [uncultured marine virus]